MTSATPRHTPHISINRARAHAYESGVTNIKQNEKQYNMNDCPLCGFSVTYTPKIGFQSEILKNNLSSLIRSSICVAIPGLLNNLSTFHCDISNRLATSQEFACTFWLPLRSHTCLHLIPLFRMWQLAACRILRMRVNTSTSSLARRFCRAPPYAGALTRYRKETFP